MSGNPTAAENGLAQRAYLAMRERILRGEYAIGQVISRRKLAADLGISFLPASEAMLRLECEGLLESRPRAGTRIRIPMREDVQGHFMVREALEVQAAMIFSASATTEQRQELISLAGRLDGLAPLAAAELCRYVEQHEGLHLKIAEGTNCGALIEAIRRRSAVEWAWRSAMKASVPESQAKHEALIRNVIGKTPAVAGAAMRAHMQAQLQSTIESLEPWFDSNRKHLPKYSRTIQRRTSATGVSAPAA